jgi:hypothetical protein
MKVKDSRGHTILSLSWTQGYVWLEDGSGNETFFQDKYLESVIEILTEYKRRRDRRRELKSTPSKKL